MRALAVAAVLLLVPMAQASYDHDRDHYVAYDPAYEAGLMPEPSDVQAAIDAIADHPWATVHTMGQSLDGLPIRVVEIADPDSTVPMDDRVITFIETQQHGNEPAGTPAAIRLFDDVKDGADWLDLLDNQILLVMPQSNPDGARDDRRANEAGEDINRDHVDVGSPEAQAIHAVLRQWDVHMAFDHHEYGGTGVGYPSPVGSYEFDITTMHPNHGNVRAPTRDLSLELEYDHVKADLEAAGYTHGDYGCQTVTVHGVASEKVECTAGGPDPGILRNNFGLNNVVGLLVESFISAAENPFQSFERRVGSHELVMHTVIQFGHDNADRLIAAKRESERLNLEEPMTYYAEGTLDNAGTADQKDGAIPDLYATAKAGVDETAFLAMFEQHGLPAPAEDGDAWLSAATMQRGGLVAAMLHPDSSRHLGALAAGDHTLPEAYFHHAEFGAVALEEVAEAADDAEAPGFTPLLALAAVAAAMLVQRRR